MEVGARKRRDMPAEEILKCRTRVQVHDYKGQLIRSVSEDGRSWIVFADICKVLGYKNPRHEIKYVKETDRLKVDIGLKNTLANCVTKHGLLTVVALSSKENAIPFLDWANDEIFGCERS